MEDAYIHHPHLCTDEELEEQNHDSSMNVINDVPGWYYNDDNADDSYNRTNRPTADASERARFEARPPALGFTEEQIADLEARAADSRYLPV